MGIRSHRLWVARIVLALMLFAQGAMAWSACDLVEHSPVRAVLASAEVAPCHESGSGGACLTYCLSDRQAVQKVSMDIPAMPSAPFLTLSIQFIPLPSLSIAHVSDSAP